MSSPQNPQKVYDFLKCNPPRPFCDDCVAKGTGVDRHEVNTIARTLALFPKEFRRASAACAHCTAQDKQTTQAL
jgi:hypothetical protein